jgi:dipeptidyl aminopeptidase/acylaminoacyl peptidase
VPRRFRVRLDGDDRRLDFLDRWKLMARAILRAVVLAALAAASISAAPATTAAADGTLVSETPCEISPVPYESYLETARKRYADEVEAAKREGHKHTTPPSHATKEQYAKSQAQLASIDCRRLIYMSDGLKVVAYIWKPKAAGGKKLPLIIFNRGGNRALGTLTPAHSFSRLALDGFVVMASQYREADGGEGRDEFGGADVRDVLNLVPLAESLGGIDMKNVFLLGWSRGGMMTALALKHGMKVNAAAVGGALTDLLIEKKRRPGLAERVWSRAMPGYAERGDEVLRERSAVFWPEQIRAPILILHGGADWRADPGTALEFAQALQRAGATYEMIIYAGDDHAISMNKEDSNRRIVEWFRRHMQ